MAEITQISLQTKLFERIKSLIPENLSIVDVLSELLEISSDSVYRRLRNETSLTIDEVSRICIRFNISFDELNTFDNASSVTFTFNPLSTVNDYKSYLQSIHDDMVKIAAAGNSKIIWAAEDIPIFHHFKSPFLGAFKVYYWFHCIIDTEEHRDKKFNTKHIDDDIINLCRDIYNLYAKIPSIEIWTDLTIASLLVQVDYVWQSGLFENKSDALKICGLIEEQLDTIQKQADLTYKIGFHDNRVLEEGTFQLYHSDIEIGNNTIFVEMGNTKVLYLTHNTLNKIVTVNKEFCDSTQKWINNLRKKSTLISGVSEKQRFQFFNKMKTQLHQLKKKIEGDFNTVNDPVE